MSEIYNRIEGERNIFVTSDHHFFHRNLIDLVGRPFQSEYGMNRHMVEQWNKVVQPEDLVVHVGDFSAGLKGRKYFMGEGLLSREAMCKTLVDGMEGAFENWKPKQKFKLIEL
jgi:calcineurin-like phosphoesterase family protein